MSSNLISVIIPIYNREKYIDRCISSVINQENVNFEIILVDDGSSDNSGQICDNYSLKYPNIITLHKKNGGLSDARNYGMDHAHGDYFFFLDSDDYLYENSLQYLLEACIKYDVDYCIGSFARLTPEGELVDISEIPEGYKDTVVDEKGLWHIRESEKLYMATVAWGKLYKKEVWQNLRYPVGKNNEDTYILPQLVSNCSKIYVSSKLVYKQELSADSIMRGKVTYKSLDAFDAYINLLNYTVPHGYYSLAYRDFGRTTRQFIDYRKILKDSKSKQRMETQYKEFCKIAREMSKQSDFKNKIRFTLFRCNLSLYAFVRKFLRG
ncbi:glycosyltransferase family 2 protein [Butyrivibrio sp. VCB2006]|uniref:glycosyltransferase family 2 protein n=1 Tax=Butyrivibrio sp. VCB2006 TaxID=1280679 RepID=UPI00041B65D2|nr:glycosyltransferase family 2 protein [Butyrivibrio sp. VCB2006]